MSFSEVLLQSDGNSRPSNQKEATHKPKPHHTELKSLTLVSIVSQPRVRAWQQAEPRRGGTLTSMKEPPLPASLCDAMTQPIRSVSFTPGVPTQLESKVSALYLHQKRKQAE